MKKDDLYDLEKYLVTIKKIRKFEIGMKSAEIEHYKKMLKLIDEHRNNPHQKGFVCKKCGMHTYYECGNKLDYCEKCFIAWRNETGLQ